ncbi:helix-turn-helix domain-containing protein [Muricauda sp. JGD-17]|uniref:Helix-turn-helix domain-containing protein n=1 Tax=Flagellimonas ochracea TaxID=2696472 RepID=A0A964TB85_9FLAO|nr:AraC family transcriptional regulator [Allomuricauda ochracea]NAY91670.1 helix-turn-helix domain-containing protein [Allomuricauda ochracea]
MDDFVRDVLETVRLKSAVYFNHAFCGPWGMNVKSGTFAQFHFVTGGNCLVRIDSEEHKLFRGDLIIFPKGHQHEIKAEINSRCLDGQDVVQDIIKGNSPFPKGEVSTHLVCGHYELDWDVSHFILQNLPKYILIRNEHYGRFDLVKTILDIIVEELSTKEMGYEIVTLRFAEILFVSILRQFYLKQTQSKTNLFKDRAIYNSVNYIHNNLAASLTIDKLSQFSGISRTLFINRFKESIGNTPLAYIKTWRMTKAKQLLKYSALTLDEISEQVGYASASAFNRVFKQTVGVSPKKFRDTSMAEVA